MSSPYEELLASGAIGSYKRDVMLEADRDLEYLGNIRIRFAHSGERAAAVATECTVRLVDELIGQGLCVLATWGEDKEAQIIERSTGELVRIVEGLALPDAATWKYFLLTTDLGREWVRRYDKLVEEL